MKKAVKRKRTKRATRVGRSAVGSPRKSRTRRRGRGGAAVGTPAPIPPARIRAIRKKLATSVRIFSERFGLPAKTVRQWERGARRPDAASSLLLEVIDVNPGAVESAALRRRRTA